MVNELHPSVRERKRIASWWIRFEDLNWPNHDGYERIKRRAEAMARANVTTAMIFGAHFRWDFLPYFTLLHDYLATVAEELGKYGVELYDHHSVNLIHRYDTREEMRHVMLHSGPHLPLSPSREAAATWEYNGSRLNDWRMVDVGTRQILWYPQYAAEGFCIRNPHFVEAYRTYVTRLIADTGIRGLSADDPVHYMHYRSCACPYCVAELKRRTGVTLPSLSDRSFWGNWENPAWQAWIDMRFEAAADFFRALKPVFPADFRVTTCGSNSAAPKTNSSASDARCFITGCNFVNLEMSGNTPPYKQDPKTINVRVAERLVTASHHRAVAAEKGVRCFGTGFAFTETTAGLVWAVNRVLGSDCWISTLKARLGLPDHILQTLPEEADIVGQAFGFEKEHEELWEGEPIGQLGVYFSYETRKHSFFGNLEKGYYKDYSECLRVLFARGISPHTIFDFPEDATKYPAVLVPSAAVMTERELAALARYRENGGCVIITGPSAHPLCKSTWQLPTHPTLNTPEEFLSVDPAHLNAPGAWTKMVLPPYAGECAWQTPIPGLYYNPHRIGDGEVVEPMLSLLAQFLRPLPTEVLEAEGYLVTMFESDTAVIVHLLAEDYDTDIDHALDEMRFHRSRVNLVTKAEPIGIGEVIKLRAAAAPVVYTPFQEGKAEVRKEAGVYSLRLPPKTAYAILYFPKANQ